MEVIERKENPLLDRVEIRFMWNHENSPTPSLDEMVAAAAKAEPRRNWSSSRRSARATGVLRPRGLH